MSRGRLFAVALATAGSSVFARADEFTFTLPPSVAIPSISSTPYSFSATNPSATAGILGYSVVGDWTTSGSAFSSGLRVAVTPPGVSTSQYRYLGGLDSGAAYTFGAGINNGAAFNVPGTPPPNAPAGTFTVSMYQNFSGDTATLSNAAVRVYSNPVSRSGTTEGAPTFIRPDIGTGPAIGPVNYAVTQFTVNATGRYMIVNAASYDSLVLLYQNAFDPLNPGNYLAAGDYPVEPYSPVGDTVVANLTAGTTYFLVSTEYNIGSDGPFTVYVAGEGTPTFSPVPEPGVTLLAAASVLAAGGWVRRRLVGRAARGKDAALPS
jgi:hypothetical protein